MNYTERKAKNQVFFYITSGSGFMTLLISVLIILGAVSTAVNMVAAMVKRICNGIEKRLLKKGNWLKLNCPFNGFNISRKQDALHSKFFTCNDIFHRIIDEEAFTW